MECIDLCSDDDDRPVVVDRAAEPRGGKRLRDEDVPAAGPSDDSDDIQFVSATGAVRPCLSFLSTF